LPQPPTTITDELGIALSNLADSATGVFTPTLRLGFMPCPAALAGGGVKTSAGVPQIPLRTS
jgi:hypothetical protein